MIRRFMDWFENAPTYKSIWFIPIVLILWLIAMIKNKFINKHKGEK
jgi:hypothetical protein